MDRIRLSQSDDWQLVNGEQDVRGRKLMDASGATLGRIDDLVLNPDRGVADALILEDGTEVPAKSVRIDSDAVHLMEAATGASAATTSSAPADTVTVYDNAGHVQRRDDVEETDGHTRTR